MDALGEKGGEQEPPTATGHNLLHYLAAEAELKM